MAAGERSQVWFPEIVDMLRAQWGRDLAWQAMVDLRDDLQEELDEIRRSRGILPPVFRCPSCGSVGPAKPPVISIRAMLISVRRFGIDSFEVSEQLEREWERYRRKNKLDLVGRSEQHLSARAKRGSRKRFTAALSRVQNREPGTDDHHPSPAGKPLQRTALARRR